MHAGHGLVRIRKVRRDGVEGVPVLVDDGRVARVIALEAQREGRPATGRWKLTRVDDHGGWGMLWWVMRIMISI